MADTLMPQLTSYQLWPEVWKESLAKFFEVSYYQKNFQPPTLPNSEDRGGMKMPYDFLFTFVTFNQQTADLGKKYS